MTTDTCITCGQPSCHCSTCNTCGRPIDSHDCTEDGPTTVSDEEEFFSLVGSFAPKSLLEHAKEIYNANKDKLTVPEMLALLKPIIIQAMNSLADVQPMNGQSAEILRQKRWTVLEADSTITGYIERDQHDKVNS